MKFAVTVMGPFMVMVTGLLVEVIPPVQPEKVYPVFGVASRVTELPATCQDPVEAPDMTPPAVGFVARVSWYSVCQFQVMEEFTVRMMLIVVPVPGAQTEFHPVHPVQT